MGVEATVGIKPEGSQSFDFIQQSRSARKKPQVSNKKKKFEDSGGISESFDFVQQSRSVKNAKNKPRASPPKKVQKVKESISDSFDFLGTQSVRKNTAPVQPKKKVAQDN